MQTSPNTVTLHLGENHSDLWINASATEAPAMQLNIGWSNVLPGPLRTSPPRPLDLEIAIQNIEEHVMPLARIIPSGTSLHIYCIGDGAPALLSVMPSQTLASPTFSLDEIETAFSRLCAIAEGSPAGMNNPLIEPANVAVLLIVRELMHHCRFTEVSSA